MISMAGTDSALTPDYLDIPRELRRNICARLMRTRIRLGQKVRRDARGKRLSVRNVLVLIGGLTETVRNFL